MISKDVIDKIFQYTDLWSFALIDVIDCYPCIMRQTIVRAPSKEKAIEKLVEKWNNGEHSDLVSYLFDSDDLQLRVDMVKKVFEEEGIPKYNMKTQKQWDEYRSNDGYPEGLYLEISNLQNIIWQ